MNSSAITTPRGNDGAQRRMGAKVADTIHPHQHCYDRVRAHSAQGGPSPQAKPAKTAGESCASGRCTADPWRDRCSGSCRSLCISFPLVSKVTTSMISGNRVLPPGDDLAGRFHRAAPQVSGRSAFSSCPLSLNNLPHCCECSISSISNDKMHIKYLFIMLFHS